MNTIIDDVRNARHLDRHLFKDACQSVGAWTHYHLYDEDNDPSISESWESAVIALVSSMLPGWAWKIGTCSVSDDAWLVPDFNHPVYGERLRAEFGYPDNVPAGSIWDGGVDIDRRPPGNTALALLEAFLTAWEMKHG